MLFYNLKLALRNLLKNKLYSFLILGGFAIGFATSILIGLYYYTEKNVNKGFANYKQIYRLYDKKSNGCNLNYEFFPILSTKYPEIKNVCPMEFRTGYPFTLKNEQTNVTTRANNAVCTTNSFFEIFSVEVIESLADKPFAGKESIALSESVAHALFGKQNPLGQKININNYFSGTVTAIIKDIPENSSFKADLIMNSDNENFRMTKVSYKDGDKTILYALTNHFLFVNEGVNLTGLTEKLNSTVRTYKIGVDSVGLQNISDIYLSPGSNSDVHFKGNAKMLKIFLAIAFLIILLSSINYLNYSISMQFAKLKEIGINKSNGASRWQMMVFSFTEVALGIGISTIVSIWIVLLLLPYSNTLFGRTLSFEILNLKEVLPTIVILLFFIILLNGLIPMYLLSKFKLNEFLSGRGRLKGKQFGKQILLTFQITVSVALIAIVIIIFKQLSFVKHADLGFDRELLLRIDFPAKFQNQEAFKAEINKLSFVKSSTLSAGSPGSIYFNMTIPDGEKYFNVNVITVGDEYLKTMGIELQDGREFHDGDNQKACLVSEDILKKFKWDNIEGKKFNFTGNDLYAIGITNNFFVKSMHTEIEPVVLVYDTSKSHGILSVRLLPGNIGDYMIRIKQAWKEFIPDEPLSFTFYDDLFQAMYTKEEKLSESITFFSFVAIILTCMGILGQIFMICIDRVKEIGIRKVNGARVSELLVMLNKDFVKWVAIAFVIATPLAYYAMNKWLENFAYKTELSWWIFVLAGLLALGIALLTVSWQSWKAATRNPVEALRYE